MESSEGADAEVCALLPEPGDCAEEWGAATRAKEIEASTWLRHDALFRCQTLGSRTIFESLLSRDGLEHKRRLKSTRSKELLNLPNGLDRSRTYQSSFRENWISLAAAALRICMNPGVPTLVSLAPPRVLNPPLALPPGGEKFTLLKILKNSDRNWRAFVSVILKFLKRAKSRLSNLGPRSVLRPRVPYVKGAGMANAAGLYQACGVCLNPAGRIETPGTGSPRCVSLEGLML